MPLFEKGHKIGRPKGSKDKSYLTLQYWYNELMKDWTKLRPAQRAKLSAQLMQMLTNKLKALPNSPEQSVINAKEAQEMLNSLEGTEAVKNESKAVVEPTNLTPPNLISKPVDNA